MEIPFPLVGDLEVLQGTSEGEKIVVVAVGLRGMLLKVYRLFLAHDGLQRFRTSALNSPTRPFKI